MENFLLLLCILPIVVVQSLYPSTASQPSQPSCNCRKVDGGLTEWTQFSPCSASCGPGTQKRVRYCTNPYPQFGGKDCTGKLSDSKSCNLKPCPVDGGWRVTQSSCSKKCGGGQATITRRCTNPPPSSCGRKCTGWTTRVVQCNTFTCPTTTTTPPPTPKWTRWVCGACSKRHGKCTKECRRRCELNGKPVSIYRCPRQTFGQMKYEPCAPGKCPCTGPNCHGTDTGCEACHQKALDEAKNQLTAYWKRNWVGHACRAPHLASRCRAEQQSKNGGLPAKHWFWVHCSADGPWCKPCATRGLVFNKKCDACETTRNGPCTGK